jgi:hypothetical protein
MASAVVLRGRWSATAIVRTAPAQQRRRHPLARAQKDDDGGGAPRSPSSPPPPPPDEQQKRRGYDAMLAQLRATGLNQDKARRLLKAWARAGALEPEQLRRLLVKRSLAPARSLGLQGAVDLGAAAFGFYTGQTVGQAGEFPGKLALQFACYFGATWYLTSGFAGLSALAQAVAAARRYASSADALLAAVSTLAGPEGVAAAAREGAGPGPASGGGAAAGVGALAAKVALAVNTSKVVAALDSVAQQLREMEAAAAAGGGAPGPSPSSSSSSSSSSSAAAAAEEGNAPLRRPTLVSLAAFLTLQDAEERGGFRPADYGLTEAEATDIAAVFAMFDSNENFVLEEGELGDMLRRLGRELSLSEVQEAARLMAGGGGGDGGGAAGAGRGITFPQFVGWWTRTGGGAGKKGAAAAAAAAAAEE